MTYVKVAERIPRGDNSILRGYTPWALTRGLDQGGLDCWFQMLLLAVGPDYQPGVNIVAVVRLEHIN